MRTYVKNVPAKFHPDPIWNGRALHFFDRGHRQQQEEQDE